MCSVCLGSQEMQDFSRKYWETCYSQDECVHQVHAVVLRLHVAGYFYEASVNYVIAWYRVAFLSSLLPAVKR